MFLVSIKNMSNITKPDVAYGSSLVG